jgi:ABC-type multidrug transport system ATPase subunit
MNPSIIINYISKSYGKTKALKDINFNVENGEIFGLIGPDGAGKTTLIRILTTLLLPDSGSATVLGFDAVKEWKEIRKIMGYMPGRFSLYQDLSVEENVKFFASVFGTTLEENYEIIKDIYSQIEPFKDRRAGQLSGGMKQKLALSCSLIHRPQILFLDEPTTGVDPVSRKEFWGILKNLKAKGITILVSTPYMDEASLCDRVALIQAGSILTIDTPADISKTFKSRLYSVSSDDRYAMIKDLREFPGTASAFPFGDSFHFTHSDPEFRENDLIKYLDRLGHKNIAINIIKPNVEDCFMDLMTEKE